MFTFSYHVDGDIIEMKAGRMTLKSKTIIPLETQNAGYWVTVCVWPLCNGAPITHHIVCDKT